MLVVEVNSEILSFHRLELLRYLLNTAINSIMVALFFLVF